MTDKEYKIICKLIDLHAIERVGGDRDGKTYRYKEINEKNIEELKKDIKELLLDEKVGLPLIRDIQSVSIDESSKYLLEKYLHSNPTKVTCNTELKIGDKSLGDTNEKTTS